MRPGSVTGARQANRSHTYTAGRPSTRPLPASSGTPSAGPDRDDRARGERGERGPGDRAVDRPDDRDLPRRREPEVERAQRPAEGARRARSSVGPTSRSTDTAAALELVVAPDPPEAQEHVREHRVPGRDRVVVEVLRARDELLAVASERGRSRRARRRRRARPRAARAGAPRAASAPRRSRRAARAGRGRRSRSRRGSPRRSPCPSRQERETPPVLARERPEQELPHAARGLEPVGALEPARALGERGEREPVPRGEHLVVEDRLRPSARARRAACARSSGSSSPRMIERPCSNGCEQLRRNALLLRPREREPLDAVRVGVLRGGEAAVRAARSSRST